MATAIWNFGMRETSYNKDNEQTVMDDMQYIEAIKVGGINVNNLRYAGGTVLLADSEENLQMIVE